MLHSSPSRFSTGVPVRANRHPAAHLADGLIFLGGVVLDGLRLVEDAGVELLPLVKRLVPAQQIVAGHHEVGGGPALSQLGAVGGVAVHHHAGELAA